MALRVNGCLMFLEAAKLLNEQQKQDNSLKFFQTLINIIHYDKPNFNLGIIISKCELEMSDQKRWKSLQLKIQELEQKG